MVDAVALDARVLLDLSSAALSGYERLGDGIVEFVLLTELLLHGLELGLGLLGTDGHGSEAALGDLELATQLALDKTSLLELGRRRERRGACLGKLLARLGELVLCFLELGLELLDPLVHRIDLVGDALEEDVDLPNVIAAQCVLESLVLDVLHRDGHV